MTHAEWVSNRFSFIVEKMEEDVRAKAFPDSSISEEQFCADVDRQAEIDEAIVIVSDFIAKHVRMGKPSFTKVGE